MQQISNVRTLMINGGKFTQARNVYEAGKDAGEFYQSLDAVYDSAERFLNAQCHPGTRERIIETIMEWIDDPTPEKQALWLYGAAGAGKSAIGQSIATMLKECSANRRYGSSFFFAKGVPGRGDGNKLFSTIAYELAINFPEYRAVLDTIMQENPTLPTKSINIQLQNLIIRPLAKVRNWPAHHPVVIIDGLDECSGEKRMQVGILSTIANSIIQHHIPLRFLIISRPEYWIADAFETGRFSSIVKRLSLQDDLEANAGIRTYLRDEFNRIYDENIEVMHSIPRTWPEDHIIDGFVHLASGQYVYASTVIKFIGDSLHCDPFEQLRILCSLDPHDAQAFSELDQLYAAILLSYPHWDRLKLVLSVIAYYGYTNSESLMELVLGVPPSELRQILRSMRSLIYMTEPKCSPLLQSLIPTFGIPRYETPWLSFHHLSFNEFLADPCRSGKFMVDKFSMLVHVFCVDIRHLRELLQGNSDIDEIIDRIGASQYHLGLPQRAVRAVLRHITKLTSSEMSIIINELTSLYSTLDGILFNTDKFIPRSKHILWILSRFKDSLLRDLCWRKERIRNKLTSLLDLLQSLQRLVNMAFSISAQEVLKTIPMDGPIFGYFVRRSWNQGTKLSFNIASFRDIGEKMNITHDVIISELQSIHDIVNICQVNGGLVETIIDLFTEEIDKIPKACLRPSLLAEWETPGLIDVVEQLNQLLNTTEDVPDLLLRAVANFLHCPAQSDIHSQEYFQVPHKMIILNILMHPQLPKSPEHLARYAAGSLDWFRRQLTGPNRRVLEEHDGTLILRLERAARATFLALLSLYIKHSSFFVVSAMLSDNYPTEYQDQHHIMDVSPMIDGTYLVSRYVDTEGANTESWLTSRVLNECLEEVEKSLGSQHPQWPIQPSDWYPHLAAFLLNVFAESFYVSTEEKLYVFSVLISNSFSPILLQCMPYAIPTQENLKKIRLMRHLWHKVHRRYRWRPAAGFSDLTMEFLAKYDRKTFCGMEYDNLISWLVELRATESRRILGVNISDDINYNMYTTDEEGPGTQ
uniref:NACHT domain-containing protein n=1 Tax=Psilocybe cubensis TaxID=181762 RepID=A0A8H7XLG5_PSICU